jgi:general secretion pathway protein F
MRSLQALRSKVLSALLYPAFLIVAAVGVTLLFVVYLIPKLTEMLDSTGGSLPLAAQIILRGQRLSSNRRGGCSHRHHRAFILGKAWLARPESAIPWARFKLRLPLFGGIFQGPVLRPVPRNDGQSARQRPHHGSGDAAHASGHRESASPAPEFEGVMRHVGEGVALSRALDRSGQFPPLLLDMVNVGEQTGDMPAALSAPPSASTAS